MVVSFRPGSIAKKFVVCWELLCCLLFRTTIVYASTCVPLFSKLFIYFTVAQSSCCFLCLSHYETSPSSFYPSIHHPSIHHFSIHHSSTVHPSTIHPSTVHLSTIFPSTIYPSTIHPSIYHPTIHHLSIHHPSTIHPSIHYPSISHLSIHHLSIHHPPSTHACMYACTNLYLHPRIHHRTEQAPST